MIYFANISMHPMYANALKRSNVILILRTFNGKRSLKSTPFYYIFLEVVDVGDRGRVAGPDVLVGYGCVI